MIYAALGLILTGYTVYTLRHCYQTALTRAYLEGYREGKASAIAAADANKRRIVFQAVPLMGRN